MVTPSADLNNAVDNPDHLLSVIRATFPLLGRGGFAHRSERSYRFLISAILRLCSTACQDTAPPRPWSHVKPPPAVSGCSSRHRPAQRKAATPAGYSTLPARAPPSCGLVAGSPWSGSLPRSR